MLACEIPRPAGENAGLRDDASRMIAYLTFVFLLTHPDLRDNRAEAAAENVEQALRLEPSNAAAQALKRAVAAKLAQEAQPLPNR